MIKYFITFFSLLTLCATSFAQRYRATIHTTQGNIEVRLFDQTPLHRDNFVTMSKSGYYDSLLFHRTISNFMIQAGDPTSKHAKAGDMLGEADAILTIPSEFRSDLRHKKGVLAAARLGDEENPQRASSSSQFYITVAPTHHLDGKYTIFGEVVEGQSVADKISKTATDRNDRPKKDIRIIKITINETTN